VQIIHALIALQITFYTNSLIIAINGIPILCNMTFACTQEDERIRKNRLALLNKIADLPRGIADLSVLPGF
jgi:hypothetical protein